MRSAFLLFHCALRPSHDLSAPLFVMSFLKSSRRVEDDDVWNRVHIHHRTLLFSSSPIFWPRTAPSLPSYLPAMTRFFLPFVAELPVADKLPSPFTSPRAGQPQGRRARQGYRRCQLRSLSPHFSRIRTFPHCFEYHYVALVFASTYQREDTGVIKSEENGQLRQTSCS